MSKVLIIINPAAGKMQSKNSLFHIVSRFCEAGWDVSVQTTLRRKHAVDIAKKGASEFDLIVCAGGDGTLNEVITGIRRSGESPELGFIPCGSTNDFAKSMGIPTTIVKATEKIIANEEPIVVDLGRFNKRYFSYIASFGAFTSTSYSTPQEMKNTFGHFAYILSALMDISNIRPCHMRVQSEDIVIEDDFIFGSVSNSTSVAGVVNLKKDLVDMKDGLFEVILVRFPKNPAELTRVIQGMTQSKFDDPLFSFFKTAKIIFETTEDVPWSLDGEYEPSGEKTVIKNIHGAVKIRK